ncbi:hypothetical protein LOZ66_001914 [Ophidiomyces ophidiicola]|nr:hypothetical protein LOZ66_001914 [Ophidiomyces ophidiicola]
MSTTSLTDSLWQRSKEKIPLLGRISKPKNDTVEDQAQLDATKAAHARRREQVRRAQRNHRERKETYVKALELEFRTLRDEEHSITMETKDIANENKMLREIMLAHDIPFPSKTPPGRPPTVVKVIGDPGAEQRLEVSVDGAINVQRLFPPPPSPSSKQFIPSMASNTHHHAPKGASQAAQDGIVLNRYSQEGSPTTPPNKHPLGLDATQVGVDFILFLEHPCLQHARTNCAKAPSSGHVFTFQTPLIANGPKTLRNNDTWEVPACHLDRLLDLAGALHLDGDITPVQAWNRIKQHPSFHKLDVEHFQKLSVLLSQEVQCFGFGAVIDDQLFTMYLEHTFESL